MVRLKFLVAFAELQVKLSADHKFDRDVELLFYYKDAHKPTAVVEAAKASAKPGESVNDRCRRVELGQLGCSWDHEDALERVNPSPDTDLDD